MTALLPSDTSLLDELNSRLQRENYPAAWREIVQWLESRSVRELRELARRRGASPHVTRKTELIAELIGLLASPESVRQALAALGEGEKAVLELIYLLASQNGLRQEEVQKGLLAWYGPLLTKNTGAYLDSLVAQGLLFREERIDSAPRRFRIPKVVSACLTSLSKHIDLYPLPRVGAERLPSTTVKELSPSILLQTVLAFWQNVKEHPLRLQITHKPSHIEGPALTMTSQDNMVAEISAWLEENEQQDASEVDHLYTVLALPSPELTESDLRTLSGVAGRSLQMLEFVYELLLNLGLVTKIGELVQVNELAMTRYQKQGELQQLQALLSAWLTMEQWSELSLVCRSIPHLRLRTQLLPQGDLSARTMDNRLRDIYADVASARQFVARLMGLLADDRWYRVSALWETILQLCPDLSGLRRASESSVPRWWLDSSSTERLLIPYDRAAWQQSYGLLFTAFVEGPLAWFGSVSLVYEGDRLVAFRPTTLGKYLLGHYPQIISHKGDMRPLTVGDDLTIKVQLGRVDTQVHDFLGQFTDLVDAESDVFRYRITPQRLNQAFENGIELNEILAFLERVSGAAIPDAAQTTLKQWWDNYGSIRLYENLTLIEFADDYALQELLNSTYLSEHIIYQLSPRVVVIKPESLDTLMAEMVRKSYTPKVKETSS